MAVEIIPATAADVTTIATIEWEAFNTPIGPYPHMFPSVDPSAWIANHAKGLLKVLDNPKKAFVKAVVDDEILGFAIWYRPKKDGDVEEKKEEPVFVEGTDVEKTKAFFGEIAKIEAGKTVPHWYLYWIGVSPKAQGKGVGKALMKWGIEQADKEKVGITLEASPAGYPFYKTLGFKECAPKLSGFDGKFVLTIMDRDYVPSASA